MWSMSSATQWVEETDLTLVLTLLSWSAHVDSWCGGMGPFGNGIIHSDAPPVQLHAVGSLHCLGNAKKKKTKVVIRLIFVKNALFH